MNFLADQYGGKKAFLRHLAAIAALAANRYNCYLRIDWDQVTRLVFVCKGNICRSAFAAAKAEEMGLPAVSFGLDAVDGDPVNAAAAAAAVRAGIDMSTHRATARKSFVLQDGDLVVVMEPEQAKKLVHTLPEGAQCTLIGLWGRPCRPHVEDPYGLSQVYFDICFRIISSAVEILARRMSDCHNNSR